MSIKKFLFAALLLLAINTTNAQVIEEVRLNKHDPYFLYKVDTNYFDLHYFAMIPPDSVNGLLVLLPGYLRKAEDIFGRTRLARIVHDMKIGVVIPAINTRISLDLATWEMINMVIKHAIAEHKIPKDKVIIGGFSSGGHLALRYAEECTKTKNDIQVQGVFAVDAPVDMKHFYNTSRKMVSLECNRRSTDAGRSQVALLEKYFGGDPKQFSKSYIQQSAYSRGSKNGGNTSFLKTTPVRLYTEPDIHWYMKIFCLDYYDINAADLSGMINVLGMMGNKEAKLMITSGKGKRKDGKRHPHSWSIVDAKECAAWMKKLLE